MKQNQPTAVYNILVTDGRQFHSQTLTGNLQFQTFQRLNKTGVTQSRDSLLTSWTVLVVILHQRLSKCFKPIAALALYLKKKCRLFK